MRDACVCGGKDDRPAATRLRTAVPRHFAARDANKSVGGRAAAPSRTAHATMAVPFLGATVVRGRTPGVQGIFQLKAAACSSIRELGFRIRPPLAPISCCRAPRFQWIDTERDEGNGRTSTGSRGRSGGWEEEKYRTRSEIYRIYRRVRWHALSAILPWRPNQQRQWARQRERQRPQQQAISPTTT